MDQISKNNTPRILNAIHASSKVTSLAGGTPLFLVDDYLLKIGNEKLFNPRNFEYPVHTQGLLELREKIAQELMQEFKKPVNTDQILITSGSTAGLYASLKALLKKGDEIILFSPHWSLYPKQIRSIGAKTVQVLLDEKNSWDVNFSRLEKAINKRTRCILLTNPASPMGSVMPRESIKQLVEFVKNRNLVLIADETYRNIIHQNIKFISPLAYRYSSSRVVLLRSFSKDFSISGLRLGYVYNNNSELMDKIISVHLAMNLSAPVLSQSIALELFKYKGQLQEKIKREYSRRYKIVASFLNQWSSVFSYIPPTTGFFVFPKYNLKLPSIDLFKLLLNKYQVAIRPGAEFGKGGEGHIRISFAYPIKHIHLGLQKITKFLDKYKK